MKQILHKSFALKAFMLVAMMVGAITGAWAETYKLEQVTSVEAGGLYVFEQTYNEAGYVMNNTVSSSTLQTTTTYKTTGLEGTESYVWTIETATGGFYFKNVSLTSNSYLNNASSTGVSLGTKSSIWAFNFQTDKTVLIQNTKNSNRFLGFPHSGGTVTTGYKAYATSNLDTYPHAIVVYKLVPESDTRTPVTLTWSATTATATLGETFTAPTLTIDPSVAASAVTYSSDDPDVASVDAAGNITIEGAGEVTIKAEIKDNATYKDASASYTLTVIDASTALANIAALTAETEAGNYDVNLTNAVVTYVNGNYAYIQDASGAIVMYKNGHGLTAGDVLNGTAVVAYQVRNSNPQITDLQGITPTSGTAPNPAEIAASAWTSTISSVLSQYFKVTGATITQTDGKYYVHLGTENVQLYGQGDARTISVPDLNSTYTIVGFPTLYNTTPELQIFIQPAAETAVRAAVVLSFGETTSFTINEDDDFTAPSLSITDEAGVALDLPVTYSSSNEEAIIVNSTTGAISIEGVGAATIIATFEGNDNYLPATASYTINVVDQNAPGATAENPYTVAQAREAIDAGSGVTGVYVKGIISQIDEISTQHGNATYWISDDGTTTNQFEVYRGKSLDGADFTNGDEIQVGDEVIIRGDIKYYDSQSVYEFSQGSSIVSLTRPEQPVVASITVSPTTISAAAAETEGTINVTYNNITQVEAELQFCNAEGAEATYDWILAELDENNNISYIISANEGEARTAYMKIYALDDDANDVYSDLITITQQAYSAPSVATLPFQFDGGVADIAETNGLTHEGIDAKDYTSSPKLKFNTTGDYLILHFDEEPGMLSFDVKGNTFSEGTFTVQTSKDGATYTDLKSYTTLGEVQSEEFELDAEVRYVKWIYTEKVNGNVALGNIYLKSANEPVINAEDVTLAASATSGEITYTITNPVEGQSLLATTEAEWISDFTVSESSVTFTTTVNEEAIARTAVITLTYGTTTKDVTVTQNVQTIEGNVKYQLIASTEELTDGQYLIVYADDAMALAFDGRLETLDAAGNTAVVSLSENIITANDEIAFTITKKEDGYTIKSASGMYIGQTSDTNGLVAQENELNNSISVDESGNADIISSGGAYLRYNASSGQDRFRYYKSSSYTAQKAIRLYKKAVEGDVNKDGKLTIADVTALVNIILGHPGEGVNMDAANVNGDDKITIADVTALVNKILKQ